MHRPKSSVRTPKTFPQRLKPPHFAGFMSELKLRPPVAIQALALCGEPKSRSLAPLGMTDYKSRRDSSTSGRDVRPAKASGTQRTCFAHKATKASRPSARNDSKEAGK